MAEIERDITRNVLAVLFIVALIGSSIWILRPFLGAIDMELTESEAKGFQSMPESWNDGMMLVGVARYEITRFGFLI